MPPAVLPASRMQPGLAILLQAFDFARETSSNSWDFAVELPVLFGVGMSRNELRWLLAQRFAEHGLELPPGENDRRAVRIVKSFQFHNDSCLILTVAGADFVRKAGPEFQSHESANPHFEQSNALGSHGDHHANPVWDRESRQVTYRGVTCIELIRAADNLETVLQAFEKAGWRPQIRDPFPPDKSGNRKRRLHNTINALNRCQTAPLIHFSSADSGRAIRWTPSHPAIVPTAPPPIPKKSAAKSRRSPRKTTEQKARQKRASQPHRNRKKYNAT